MIETKSLYSHVYANGGYYLGPYEEDPANFNPPADQMAAIQSVLREFTIPAKATVVEVGCGVGRLHPCHPNWSGIEYSKSAVELAKSKFGSRLDIREGDARNLALPDGFVDLLFSFAALEHIPHVERAFAEVERTLRPGGIALLGPAWNCRPWTVKKLEQRPYAELGMRQKVGKFLIPLRNSLVFRMLVALPSRLHREFQMFVGRRGLQLDYRELEPDFSLWDRYRHIADDDAFVSMDAHAALAYFHSRGWRCESHPGFFKRLACRGEAIIVRKPL